ncbi:RagB/SusD family nutrient uptake outer membrane protein [uncultured Cyclobacterium sp.]|uniref:RagB/SusD family nutrient uptake outer membrane protein n=1 Tax=uncultured Cyclobacterium sp. TaxID=453820 RepID=UPI0030EF05B8|tara:strand:- start:60959 stop:62488 length:1530 start_codon:yes stop_codon:yes gene_type:complete
MKKLIYIYIIFCLSLQSCSNDFIEIAPQASVTTANFYKTQSQFEQALIGSYESIRDAKGSVASWVMGEMRSDNTHYEYNNLNRGVSYSEREDTAGFLDDNSSSYISSKYNSCYTGIARVNQILDKIDAADFSLQTKDRISGEAKFIRALLYFELVRYFGGVSLHLNAVEGAAQAYLQRSSVAEVYQAIESDLNDAIQQLPVASFPQNGRATKGAAQVLLADAFMAQKKYANAETALKATLQMGYELMPDYSSVFNINNKNSKESIFEVQYQEGNQGQQSNFLYPFLPLSSDVSLITGIQSQNRNGGGWNTPTQEMIESYEPGDSRLEASIGIIEGTGPVGEMVIEKVTSPLNYTTPENKRSYAYIKKYQNTHSVINNTDDNFPIYRYSDALLLLAEALNEQGKTAEALTHLNRVRERAGLLPSVEVNQGALQDIILHERRVEFAFENKRWLDLVRTDRAIEVMNQHGQYLKTLHPILRDVSYNVTTNRLLFPIPQREILIGRLEQNPGY